MGLLSNAGAQALARPSGLFDRGLRDQLAYQSLVLEQWFRTTYGMAKANSPVAP